MRLTTTARGLVSTTAHWAFAVGLEWVQLVDAYVAIR